MSNTSLITFIIILRCLASQSSFAQIDLECNGRDMHSIYLVGSTGYYRIDSVDTAPTNAVFLAPNSLGAIGISINNNLNVAAAPVTMYMCNSLYYYWNGTGWTNTGHSTGNSSAVNPGGSADYIFNINDDGLALYRYDGNINLPIVTNIGSPSDFVHDVATDNQGNFYLMFTNAHQIVSFTSSGIPIDTFSTTGFPIGSQCGIAILGERFYASICGTTNKLYEGIKSGSNINFTMIKDFGIQASDIAACPNAALPLSVSKDPESPHFTVYPNPVNDVAHLKLHNTSVIEIYNSLGILIKTISVTGLEEFDLDVAEWKRGIYFICIRSEKNSSVRGKLVVE